MVRILEIGDAAAGYAGRLFVHAQDEVVRLEPDHAPNTWSSQESMDLFLHADKRRLQTTDNTLLAALAAEADVVICETTSAQALDQLGFDDWSCPIKVSITPFGRTGPKRNWQATPNVLLAMGGYTNLMGDADKPPLSLPGHYVEFQSGALAYTASSACLLNGEHNSIDISMLEVVMSLSQYTTVKWHCAGEIRSRHGSDFWSVCPSNLFSCRDGWVYVNIVPLFWDAFTLFLDQPELLLDARFTDNDLRMKHRQALDEIIAQALVGLSKAEVEERATQCRVPVGIVQLLGDVLSNSHLREREFWQAITTDNAIQVQAPGLPYRINHAPRQPLHLSRIETQDG